MEINTSKINLYTQVHRFGARVLVIGGLFASCSLGNALAKHLGFIGQFKTVLCAFGGISEIAHSLHDQYVGLGSLAVKERYCDITDVDAQVNEKIVTGPVVTNLSEECIALHNEWSYLLPSLDQQVVQNFGDADTIFREAAYWSACTWKQFLQELLTLKSKQLAFGHYLINQINGVKTLPYQTTNFTKNSVACLGSELSLNLSEIPQNIQEELLIDTIAGLGCIQPLQISGFFIIGGAWNNFFYNYFPVPLPCSLEKIILVGLPYLPKGLLDECPQQLKEFLLLSNLVSWACDNKLCSNDGNLRNYLIRQINLSTQSPTIVPS